MFDRFCYKTCCGDAAPVLLTRRSWGKGKMSWLPEIGQLAGTQKKTEHKARLLVLCGVGRESNPAPVISLYPRTSTNIHWQKG